MNKPELLPKDGPTTVIDVAGFLTSGEVCSRQTSLRLLSWQPCDTH